MSFSLVPSAMLQASHLIFASKYTMPLGDTESHEWDEVVVLTNGPQQVPSSRHFLGRGGRASSEARLSGVSRSLLLAYCMGM